MQRLDDLEKRHARLEARVDNLEQKDKVRRSEWEAERDTTLQAITRHVERSIGDRVDAAVTLAFAPLKALVDDVASLKSTNEDQTKLLREAAEERGRRAEREAQAEERRKTRTQDLDEQKLLVDAKIRRLTIIAGVLGPLLLALAGAVGVAVGSHH